MNAPSLLRNNQNDNFVVNVKRNGDGKYFAIYVKEVLDGVPDFRVTSHSMHEATEMTALRIDYLKKLMSGCDVSQRTLAKASGVNYVAIHRLLSSGRDTGNNLSLLETTLTNLIAKRTAEFVVTLGAEDQATNSGERANLFLFTLTHSIGKALEAVKA
jgi:hypothetical protein